jgi:hypothetical protein
MFESFVIGGRSFRYLFVFLSHGGAGCGRLEGVTLECIADIQNR